MATLAAVSPDVLITIKLQIVRTGHEIENRRIKLPLRDLGANTLPDKLRTILKVQASEPVVFERFSDSAGTYIVLDNTNPSIYKQLYRAAKAKLKLRIKATIAEGNASKSEPTPPEPTTFGRLTSNRYVPPSNVEAAKASNISIAATLVGTSNAPSATIPAMFARQVNPPAVQASNDQLDQVYEEIERIGSQVQAEAARIGLRFPAKAPSATNSALITPAPSNFKPSTPVTGKTETDEAPLPDSFADREKFFEDLAILAKPHVLRAMDQDFHVPGAAFTVCCNHCKADIPDTHWHCSICNDSDYDLCRKCITAGVHCGVEGHFLIKRTIENGKVIASTTETLPKKAVKIETEKEIPGAFTSDVKEEHLPETLEMSRTCNCCVNVFEESNFVTCTVCEDYDLCIPCHVSLKHGHHPSHAFAPVSEESALDPMARLLCAPGRNLRHFATCDGCDKYIYGVRHKCLNCPDWDYCSTCVKSSRLIHPGHRFVSIYESLPNVSGRPQVHHGINCDGPLCKDKPAQGWIIGDRYKCAVCHDTDFCANCEALPGNKHNRTHPLIKFRTPVRNVSVTTLGEKENGEAMATMGDRLPQTSSKSTETTPAAPSANAATQVQTIAEVKPSEPVKEETVIEKTKPTPTPELQAHFVRDTIPDGSKLPPGVQVQQVWVLRNPGPAAWPAGCSVRFIGGDGMLNVDGQHPASIGDIVKATESNVCNRVVQPGEEAFFFVTIKTPQRPGKAISYWRLKTADGIPFGNKLWCDIDVIEPSKPVEIEQPKVEIVEPVTKDTEEEAADVKEEPKEESQSQMIFPTLEKESPISSIHEPQTEKDVAPPSSISSGDQELLDEVESLELDDGDSSDDGFLTDEEYEILDVHSDDEEATNGKNKK